MYTQKCLKIIFLEYSIIIFMTFVAVCNVSKF